MGNAVMFKKGDSVRIRSYEELRRKYGGEAGDAISPTDAHILFVPDMAELGDTYTTIMGVKSDHYTLVGNRWMWQDWMLEADDIGDGSDIPFDTWSQLLAPKEV